MNSSFCSRVIQRSSRSIALPAGWIAEKLTRLHPMFFAKTTMSSISLIWDDWMVDLIEATTFGKLLFATRRRALTAPEKAPLWARNLSCFSGSKLSKLTESTKRWKESSPISERCSSERKDPLVVRVINSPPLLRTCLKTSEKSRCKSGSPPDRIISLQTVQSSTLHS